MVDRLLLALHHDDVVAEFGLDGRICVDWTPHRGH